MDSYEESLRKQSAMQDIFLYGTKVSFDSLQQSTISSEPHVTLTFKFLEIHADIVNISKSKKEKKDTWWKQTLSNGYSIWHTDILNIDVEI